MRKIVGLVMLIMFVLPTLVTAESAKPNIAIIYYDNLNSHKSIRSESENFYITKLTDRFSPNYTIFYDEQNKLKLENAGINDPATAERGDIISVFRNDNLSYIILIDMLPKVVFNGKTTSSQYLKVIDVNDNKTLYNGKFQYQSRYASSMGHTGELFKQTEEVLIRLLLPAVKDISRSF